jgi:tRNA modification GTPase
MEDLTAAPTLRSAEVLLDQVHGALGRALEHLIGVTGRVAPLGPDSPLLSELDALIRRADVGTRLVRGWKVVITGRPNVGKSRLFNKLAGFERSIVDPRAGVTRDVVTIRTAFGGWPVELSDTAGDRDSSDDVEQQGIGRARRERRAADLVLLVLDRSEPLQDVDRALLETMTDALVVANKSDLTSAWDTATINRGATSVPSVSSATGEGLEGLVHSLEMRLVPEPPAPGLAVPFRAEHLRSLERGRACLVSGDPEGFVRCIEEAGGLESPR